MEEINYFEKQLILLQEEGIKIEKWLNEIKMIKQKKKCNGGWCQKHNGRGEGLEFLLGPKE